MHFYFYECTWGTLSISYDDLFHFYTYNYLVRSALFHIIISRHKNTISNLNTKELKTLPDSSYVHNLVQIVKEEQLKSGFSNYLHDEILQDILAVKNMMNKSNKKKFMT